MNIEQSLITTCLSFGLYIIYKGIKAYRLRSSCNNNTLEIEVVEIKDIESQKNNEHKNEEEEKKDER
jgi:hypothetical protein